MKIAGQRITHGISPSRVVVDTDHVATCDVCEGALEGCYKLALVAAAAPFVFRPDDDDVAAWCRAMRLPEPAGGRTLSVTTTPRRPLLRGGE